MRENYLFSQVPIADIPRSAFDRSHGYKTTFDSGYLVPFYVDEALPGDTFNVRASLFARMNTPVVPFMDNLWLDVFFFAVPNRLLWTHWVNLMGERAQIADIMAPPNYVVPRVEAPAVNGWPVGSLADYFGIPTDTDGIFASALPFRAYNLIWNEWFRDENLQDPVQFYTGDADDPAVTYSGYGSSGTDPLLRRGKRHDYFTSCLPWPQKGPGVMLPLGTTAPVIPDPGHTFPDFATATGYNGPAQTAASVGGERAVQMPEAGVGVVGNLHWATAAGMETGLLADLSAATAATINSLREAFQIQKLLEKDARGGTRYVELLKAHFGVVSPDFRLQRPEFLGGGSVPVHINPVVQNSATPAVGTPQGHLAAFGVVGASGLGFAKSFTEHMVVMGLLMVRADLTYQEGLHRMWSRRTRYDFYWPSFAHLGEQAVLMKEIVAVGDPQDETVWGYQERWAEYRYFPSLITGKLRSSYATSLDVWHLAQDFGGVPPLLGASFIEEHPPISRVVAVQNEPEFTLDARINIHAARPMPVYSTPGLIDHF